MAWEIEELGGEEQYSEVSGGSNVWIYNSFWVPNYYDLTETII